MQLRAILAASSRPRARGMLALKLPQAENTA
jgi:hypothetical protein